MNSVNNLKGVLILFVALLAVSCGSNEKSNTSTTTAKKSNNILPSKCDKIIKEYDELTTKAIQMAKDRIDGKEVSDAEQEKLEKDAEELGKRIMKMGYVGLGGQHCYQEFVNIQMKWTELAMEVQEEAIKKAMEKME